MFYRFRNRRVLLRLVDNSSLLGKLTSTRAGFFTLTGVDAVKTDGSTEPVDGDVFVPKGSVTLLQVVD